MPDLASLAGGGNNGTVCDMKKWRYRIEGGQKMVFCQTLPTHDQAKVLCLYSAVFPFPQSLPQPLFKQYLSPYLLSTEIVPLSPEFTHSLVSKARPQRPSNRPPHFVAHDCGTMHPDLGAYFGTENTTLVEIKPKCGVLSVSRLIPTEVAHTLRKYTTPTYHVKNYLVVDGVIPKNPYCPADMLSGDEARMQKAAAALQRQRAKTLRVFSAGSYIDMEPAKKMVQAAVTALAHDEKAIRGVQKIQEADVLDTSGAEKVMEILSKRVGPVKAEKLIAYAVRGGQAVDVSDDVIRARRCIAYNSAEDGARRHDESQRVIAMKKLKEMSDDVLVRLAADFLQAAAAKDCSLMVALCRKDDCQTGRRPSPSDRTMLFDGMEWLYRIWVVDVGPKDVQKITSRWPKEESRRVAKLRNRTSE